MWNELQLALCIEIFAISWAFMEIQVEGIFSWAGTISTIRFKLYTGDKDFTLYHLCLYIMVFSLILLGYIIFVGTISWEILKIIPILILIMNFEDINWYLINPFFGWDAYKSKIYPAFKDIFIWKLPIDYYFGSLTSLIIWYIFGYEIISWLKIYFILIVCTILIAVIFPRFISRNSIVRPRLKSYYRDHVFFWDDQITAEVNVVRSDGICYSTTCKGISFKGRISKKYLKKHGLPENLKLETDKTIKNRK